MKTIQYPFYFITIGLFLCIISPEMLSDGMFMDGLLYAAIANNLANGLGSFWDLYLSSTIFPHFHEHPPLAFGLQGLFFIVFGDNIIVERIYSLSTFFITGYIIVCIWNQIVENHFRQMAWLPLVFWIAIPLVSWAPPNNMLENTMMIFTSLSVLFLLKSIERNRFINLLIAGLMIVLGVLTKGLVALFPLSFLFFVFIIFRQISFYRLVTDLLILISSIVISFVVLFLLIPESLESLMAYFNNQVVGSLEGVQTVDSRFFILLRLLEELIPMGILAVIVLFFSRKFRPGKLNIRWSVVFLSVGLSGVIPIMISLKQSGFYILATFPFFSIAIAYLLSRHVDYLICKIEYKSKGFSVFKFISFAILLLSITMLLIQISKTGRDKEKIEDIHSIIQLVNKTNTISIQKDLRTDWSLHGYFQRYANISLDAKHPFNHKYVLVRKGNTTDILSKYKKVSADLNLYDLYKKE